MADPFLSDVLSGLSSKPRSIPCKYFYDARGSALFEEITRLAEYYPTRAELAILHDHARDMAEAIGPEAVLVEPGSGSSVKTRLLLDHLERPAAYVPIDISEQHLLQTAEALREDYPALTILPLAGDFSDHLALPDLPPHRRRVVYFPGSTIGNFEHREATEFLLEAARTAGAGGALLIGVDLKKDPRTLERAYDDERGITAAFNRNLLERMARELDADVDPLAFDHRAVWNEGASRVELYLVSTRDQQIRVDGQTFDITEGEAIHTENSHKYTVEGFARLAKPAGFTLSRHWLDPDELFSVLFLTVDP
jgi:dimethylhistidine N-methyltransferase